MKPSTIATITALTLLAAACTDFGSDSVSVPAGIPASTEDFAVDGLNLDFVAAQVDRVSDGDSLVLVIDGRATEVRLQGINAPERDECLGTASKQRLEDLVDSGSVAVAADGFDQFDRLLGIVTVDGLPVNVTQVLEGLAIPLATDSPVDDLVLAAEARARESRVGIWDPAACGSGPLAAMSILSVDYNPPGRDEENLDAERVVIRNDEESIVSLDGWVLRDESTANRFSFPRGTSIAPGSELEIVVGCTAAANRVTWCNDRPVWNNGGDTALLIDDQGRIVDLFRYRDG